MKMYAPAGFLIAAFLAACGSNSPGDGQGNAVAPTPISTAAAPVADPVALGKSAKAGDVLFSITDVTTPKQIGSVGVGPKAEAGETFLVVSYRIKNISARPLPPSARPTVVLIDPAGQRYEPDEMASGLAALHAEDTGGFSADLNPNVSAKNCAAWKLDAKAFDRGTWRFGLSTDPQMTFALK